MPSLKEHHQKLQRLYLDAPINQPYGPEVRVSEGSARVTLRVGPQLFYPRDSAHSSVAFEALHDASFLAASSLVPGGALLTTRFVLEVSGPVWEEEITAMGRVISSNAGQFYAEARLYNAGDEEVAFGEGQFSRSNVELPEE